MTFKLSLTGKALILVAVPLLFELAFVCLFISLERASELETERAVRAREVSDHLNNASRIVYQIVHLLDDADGPRQRTIRFLSLYRTRYLPALEALQAEYDILGRLTNDSIDLHVQVTGVAKELATLHESLDRGYELAKTGQVERLVENYKQEANMVLEGFENVLVTNFRILATHERQAMNSSTIRQAAERKFMTACVLGACAVNGAFCIFLAIFLVKGVTARLSVLSENARRVANNEQLKPFLTGDDEIAAVDKTIHSMADTLEETARIRQEFVSMVTHDLRTPLTAIRGSLEMLEVMFADNLDATGKRLVDAADRNSERMISLINDLLDVQKIKAGMMTITTEKVCVAEVLENVALSLGGMLEDAQVKLKIDDTDLFVSADRQKLERILFNLLANAIKFSPHGGTIFVGALDRTQMVEIRVTDEGKGIPKEQQKEIFERFRQVGDATGYGGSGLGLTICKNFVELHGGRIWVESEGKGTTFAFTMAQA